MSFANGLLAFGAFAFTVPLVIHLFYRSRFRTVDWGAMHLLQDVLRRNQRRIQWMNLLLLALRCCIPVLLAFCLARPVLTGFRALPGSDPRTVVIAVDDSRSMAYAQADGITRMQAAQRAVIQFLDSLTRHDEVMLIRSSRVEAIPGSMGVVEAKRQVTELTPQSGPVDLGRLMRAAHLAASEGRHSDRQLVVVSDFQSHMLSDQTFQTLRQLGQNFAQDQTKPDVNFLNVQPSGDSSRRNSNLSVQTIKADSAAVISGREAELSATIRNHGDIPIEGVPLGWSIDGIPLRPQSISIPPRSSITSQIKHDFDAFGVHQVAVSVEHADPLPPDNRRAIAVEVIDKVNVLLVDDRPRTQPLGGQADFLAMALRPFAFAERDRPDVVRTDTTSPSGAIDKLASSRYQIVILAGVRSPTQPFRATIAKFVHNGGHLIMFDHPKLDTAIYNSAWNSDIDQNASSRPFRFPAQLGPFAGAADAAAENQSSREKRWKILHRNAVFSAWNLLGDSDDSLLSEIDVSRYRLLQLAESADQAAEARARVTLLSLDNGDPFAVMSMPDAMDHPTDQPSGSVVQFAISADLASSNLPTRVAFLPMMQQLVLTLAGAQHRTTFNVGETIALDPQDLDFGKPDPNSNVPMFVVTSPDGQQRVYPTGRSGPTGTRSFVFSETYLPGAYQFRLQESDEQATSPAAGGRPLGTVRVVDVPPEESDSQLVHPQRLAEAAKLFDAQLHASANDLVLADRIDRFGREVYHWLLAILLIALVAELWLQQTLGGTARTSQPAPETNPQLALAKRAR